MTPRQYAAWLRGMDDRIRLGVGPALNQSGEILRTHIMANVSGSPVGVITGNYRRSWRVNPIRVGSSLGVSVGTNAPQGRRLEYGFNGADSLGRVYNQAPRPHVAPAVQRAEPQIIARLEQAVAAANR